LPGEYKCNCFTGYKGDGTEGGDGCTDIDECATDVDDCHVSPLLKCDVCGISQCLFLALPRPPGRNG
jgi:hypothetical protein